MPTFMKLRVALFVASVAITYAAICWREVLDEHEENQLMTPDSAWGRGYACGRLNGMREAGEAVRERWGQLADEPQPDEDLVTPEHLLHR